MSIGPFSIPMETTQNCPSDSINQFMGEKPIVSIYRVLAQTRERVLCMYFCEVLFYDPQQ